MGRILQKPIDYKQYDTRWRYHKYATKGESCTIWSEGCGPTACADLAAMINPNINPVTVADWMLKNGYKCLHSGTYYDGIQNYFKSIGVKAERLTSGSIYGKPNDTAIKKALQAIDNGAYVIATMGPGVWTKSGHYVTIYGYDSNYVYVCDPASTRSSRLKGSLGTWKKQVKQLHVIYISGSTSKDKNVTDYKVKTTANLNVRKGAGTGYDVVKVLNKGTQVTVTAENNGWGKIENNQYISLDYTQKVTSTTTTTKKTTTKTTTNNTEKKSINVYYSVMVEGGKTYPEVKNCEDYAGVKGKAITKIKIRVPGYNVKYRVHVKGGNWLPYVSSGYAGNGKAIDAMSAVLDGKHEIVYRLANIGKDYSGWQCDENRDNGLIGATKTAGKEVDRLQIRIKVK